MTGRLLVRAAPWGQEHYSLSLCSDVFTIITHFISLLAGYIIIIMFFIC